MTYDENRISDQIDGGLHAQKDELLKRCPFCAGKAEITQIGKDGLIIKCNTCLIQKKQRVMRKDLDWLKDRLIKNWNTRI